MDIFEWSCSKEFHPKSKHFDDSAKCHAYMTAHLVKGNCDGVPDDLKTHLAPLGFSLKKQSRWKMIEQFRQDVHSFNEYENVQVSALEKRNKDFDGNNRNGYNDTIAYHTLDRSIDDCNPAVHRYATKAYANELTLTMDQKESRRKKKKMKRFPVKNDSQPSEPSHEPEPEVHLRYNFMIPCTSASVWESQRRHTKPWVKRQLNRHVFKANGKNDISKYAEPWELLYPDCDVSDHDEYSDSDPDANDEHLPCFSRQFTMNDFMLDSSDANLLRKRKRVLNSGTNENLLGDDLEDTFLSDNFEMIPVEFNCPIEHLECTSLKNLFGSNYYECSCIPRRFCIDISGLVKKVLSIAQQNSSIFIVKTLCVFEVVPPSLKDCNLYDIISLNWDNNYGDEDDDDDCETNRILFWINGVFNPKVKNLILPCLELNSDYTIEDVVRSAVELIGTLPAECFLKQWEQGTAILNNNYHNTKKLQYQLSEIEGYTKFRDVGEDLCDLCGQWLVDNDGLCLAECQHWYCKSCWMKSCNKHLTNNNTMKCLEDCDVVIDYDTLTTILPLSHCLFAKKLYQIEN